MGADLTAKQTFGKNVGTDDLTNGGTALVQAGAVKTELDNKLEKEDLTSKDGSVVITKAEKGNKVDLAVSKKLKDMQSIEFAKTKQGTGEEAEEVATGKITGLADLDERSDLSSAVNKRYVDTRVATVNNHIAANRNAIIENSQRINKLDTSTRRGIAGSVAHSGVKFQEIGLNQMVVGAAMGYYKGEGAVAVGVQAAPTENVRVHSTVAATPADMSETSLSVGASWRFNIK